MQGGNSAPTADHIVVSDAFRKFYSRHCMKFDTDTYLWLGAVIHLCLLPSLPPSSVYGTTILLLLSITCPWIVLFRYLAPKIYSKHRQTVWAVHFAIQHAVAPWIIRVGLGLDFISPVASTTTSLGFVLGVSFLSTTLPWHCLNVLVYRPTVKHFLITQPIMLFTTWILDMHNCTWAVEHYKPLADDSFSTAVAWGRALSAISTPNVAAGECQSLLIDNYTDHHLEFDSNPAKAAASTFPLPSSSIHSASAGYCGCVQITTFLFIVVGFLLPWRVLTRLEKHAYKSFLEADVATLTWDGGPSAQDIKRGLDILRQRQRVEDAAKEAESLPKLLKWRQRAVAYVLLVVLWHLLDVVIIG